MEEVKKEVVNPFSIAQRQLDIAAEKLNLDSGIHAILREPMRELHVSIPVKASAVLAASIFHFGEISISQAKRYLKEKGIPVRT